MGVIIPFPDSEKHFRIDGTNGDTFVKEVFWSPKLGRSCRCIYMLGRGYESVVEMFYL